jgi:hypothetical protein
MRKTRANCGFPSLAPKSLESMKDDDIDINTDIVSRAIEDFNSDV